MSEHPPRNKKSAKDSVTKWRKMDLSVMKSHADTKVNEIFRENSVLNA